MESNLSNSFFTNNRKRLVALLKQQSIAVFNSNDILPTNADGTFPFKQNNDLYYLTGIKQEETILLLFPDAVENWQKEILFILEPNALHVKWEGHKLSKEEAAKISGISEVRYLREFKSIFKQLAVQAQTICINTNEHTRAKLSIQTRDDRFLTWCKTTYTLHNYERLAPLIQGLRVIKQDEEIVLLRQAAFITEKGFRRVLKFIKPGVHQKQVEAEMIHEYMQYLGTWADYQPIVASGADTCILHCNSNHKVVQNNELVLIDAAAAFAGYNADLTRAIPANGIYTTRQKEVYNAVLYIHKQMKMLLKSDALMKDLQNHCNELLIEQLVALGVCSMNDIKLKGSLFYIQQYCGHNFSHFIGLDVHDVGDYNQKLAAGMVLTNEPGIYINEEQIGIRIENNIVLTQKGIIDLMETVPIEAAAIEELMNS
ncbi:MAG: aminopeptidase P family protein [Bacteroidota bacterium]